MHLAFVTDARHDQFAEDDRLLVHFLQDKGHEITPAVWDDPAIDWTSFTSIIFRSPWDYFIKIDAFTDWLNQLEKLKPRVFNPISVIQWNKNKNYLMRFRDLGVTMPEFQYCEQGGSFNLEDILKNQKWSKAVIKPSISGGAHKTWVIDLHTAPSHQDAFDELILEQGVIVQKFSEEIIMSGELSLIYFNKKFSHAICKQVKSGEFRVQSQYGGRHSKYLPGEKLFKQVEDIFALIPDLLLYARIDGYLNEDDIFCLMELELLEPTLFFDSDPQACDRFYQALIELQS